MEYTAQEVAVGFGVNKATIDRWANQKGLRYRRTGLKKRMYSHDDVMRFATEHGLEFTPPKATHQTK